MLKRVGKGISVIFTREYSRRQQFIFGAIAVLAVSIVESLKHRALNYYIYEFATNDYWNLMSPYVDFCARNGCDVFIYLPPFLPLFSLFVLLPQWLGPIVWNMMNFSLLFYAISLLPSLSGRQKQLIFFFPFLITLQTLFSFQYNVVVAYLFLFAFAFLERGRYWWGLLFITISMLTKVYGGVEFLLLLFYPQFWKNVGRTAILSLVVFLLPLLNWGCDIITLYADWYGAIDTHQTTRLYESVIRLVLLYTEVNISQYGTVILASVLALIILFTFIRKKKMQSLANRYMLLGLLMSTIIVWGTSSEIHTYCIHMFGLAIWYLHLPSRNSFVKLLFWLNFILFSVLPVDFLSPREIYNFVVGEYAINMILVLITWGTMFYYTFFSTRDTIKESTPF